jgi:hypothetical protein
MEDKKRKYETALQWEKENVIRYSVKLLKTTDSDIIEYMEDKPKQTTIKKALRQLFKEETENN